MAGPIIDGVGSVAKGVGGIVRGVGGLFGIGKGGPSTEEKREEAIRQQAILEERRQAARDENLGDTSIYQFGQKSLDELAFERGIIENRIRELRNQEEGADPFLAEEIKAEIRSLKQQKSSIKEAAKQSIARDALSGAYGNLVLEADDRYSPIGERGERFAERGEADLGIASDSYRDVLSGEAPTMAELQMSKGVDRANAAGMALATSGRGNQALGIRSAVNNAAVANMDGAREGALIRMQEQEAARAALGNMGLQGAQFGTNAQITSSDAFMDQANQSTDTAMGLRTEKSQRADAKTNRIIGGVTGGLQAASGMASAMPGGDGSDVRVKKNVEQGAPAALDEADQVSQMLEQAPPYTYDYKDPSMNQHTSQKKHTGLMAQDLERTPMGSRFVQEDPEGVKRVNYQAMAPALAAGVSQLKQEVDQIKQVGGLNFAQPKKKKPKPIPEDYEAMAREILEGGFDG